MLEERSVFGVHGVDPGLELQELDHANVLVHGVALRVCCQIELVAGADWCG